MRIEFEGSRFDVRTITDLRQMPTTWSDITPSRYDRLCKSGFYNLIDVRPDRFNQLKYKISSYGRRLLRAVNKFSHNQVEYGKNMRRRERQRITLG